MTGNDSDDRHRLIDAWFPCPEVDVAVRSLGFWEKRKHYSPGLRLVQLLRPAPLSSPPCCPMTIPRDDDIRAAVLHGDKGSLQRLRDHVEEVPHQSPGRSRPFQWPRIIPWKRPVVTLPLPSASTFLQWPPWRPLAGGVPAHGFLGEPALPFGSAGGDLALLASTTDSSTRLVADVEVGSCRGATAGCRKGQTLLPGQPPYLDGAVPWAYLWAVTIPCDRCLRRPPPWVDGLAPSLHQDVREEGVQPRQWWIPGNPFRSSPTTTRFWCGLCPARQRKPPSSLQVRAKVASPRGALRVLRPYPAWT